MMMAEPEPISLDGAIDIALARDGRAGQRPFGAGGLSGPVPDFELESEMAKTSLRPGVHVPSLDDPFSRMFATEAGEFARQAIGNEARTLAAFYRFSTELLAEVLEESGFLWPSDRLLVTGGTDNRPPILLVLSDRVDNIHASRVLSDELDFALPAMARSLAADATGQVNRALGPESTVFDIVRSRSTLGITEALAIARPEVVVTSRPSMVPITAPRPGIGIYRGESLSSAGLFCRNAEGIAGVTACLHGTGPVGTEVTVGGIPSVVALASEVQDLVFVPLERERLPITVVGAAGLRAEVDLAPVQGEKAVFDGAVTKAQETIIDTTDRLLFRWNPAKQLRIQTRRDTDHGDSGSALIDASDRILGFAFEMTGYGEYPQFTDWIWAPNALRALGLTPMKVGEM